LNDLRFFSAFDASLDARRGQIDHFSNFSLQSFVVPLQNFEDGPCPTDQASPGPVEAGSGLCEGMFESCLAPVFGRDANDPLNLPARLPRTAVTTASSSFRRDEDAGPRPADRTQKAGRSPREIAITPNGCLLLATSQDDDPVEVFTIHRDDGTLNPPCAPLRFGTPVCLCCVPHKPTETMKA
jgi:hypothetical protein